VAAREAHGLLRAAQADRARLRSALRVVLRRVPETPPSMASSTCELRHSAGERHVDRPERGGQVRHSLGNERRVFTGPAQSRGAPPPHSHKFDQRPVTGALEMRRCRCRRCSPASGRRAERAAEVLHCVNRQMRAHDVPPGHCCRRMPLDSKLSAASARAAASDVAAPPPLANSRPRAVDGRGRRAEARGNDYCQRAQQR